MTTVKKKKNILLIHITNCWHDTKLKVFRSVYESIFYILMKLGFGNWIHSNTPFTQTNPLSLCTTQIDNLFSNQKNLPSVHITRLYPFDSCVILCGLHDNCLGEPPIKPTSAVISSPKSFVIALICILQLSVSSQQEQSTSTKDWGYYNYYISGFV